jgi:membrane protein CcdC involved in cytochrome C biogenesis
MNLFSTTPFPQLMPVVGSIAGFLAVLAWRVQEARSPVSVRKIVIPPLGMATGMSMFILPSFRVPWSWALAAFLLGALVFAYPLVRTSRLEREGDVIMMRRSKIFFAVIFALAAVRFLARGYLDHILSVRQTGAVMYLLALGMIVRWRTQMYFEYRRIVRPADSSRD